MSDFAFTPAMIHKADPALYYAGMIHAYSFSKLSKNNERTPDEEKELECHRGATFFFVVSGFIRIFGRVPRGTAEATAVDQVLVEIGVPSRWRPSGRGSSQGEAEQGSSGPSEA